MLLVDKVVPAQRSPLLPIVAGGPILYSNSRESSLTACAALRQEPV
jgi:hypothetical protein